MIKVTTKRQDAEGFIGRAVLKDLEAGRYNGNIPHTLDTIKSMLDLIAYMPADDIGENAKNGAFYASLNVDGALDLIKELRRWRSGDLYLDSDGHTHCKNVS